MLDQEYIVVSDKNSEIVLSTDDREQVIRCVDQIEKCGGACTVFKRINSHDLV